MRLRKLWRCSFYTMLAFGGLSACQAFGQEATEPQEKGADAVLQAFHDTSSPAEAVVQTGHCDSGCNLGGGLDLDAGSTLSRGQYYGGGEYLSVRSTFSESVAFISTTTDPVTGDESSVFNELGFGYEENYRVFLGYRLPECGGQIEFGFTNFGSSGSTASPASEAPSATVPFTAISAPLAELPVVPGQSLVTTGSVDAQAFDLAFSRTIPLGSPPPCGGCCDGCDDGCGSCCGGWCPAWDITWSGGLRYADVDWNTTTTAIAPLPGDATVSQTLDFNGLGLRFGMQGRRYVGRSQYLSFFLKGDISLLLGDIDLSIVQDVTDGSLPDNSVSFSTTQIVPVTDIVAGATLNVSNNFTVSGGYLLSAWHDLGMRGTTVTDSATAAIPDLSFDDANILGFDGFFLRGEYAF